MDEHEKQFGVLTTEIKEVSDKDRVLRFMGTTAVRDRMNDEIPLKGWDFDNYLKAGGPVLWAHKYDEPPIGRTLKIERGRANGSSGYMFDIEFAPGDANPKAEQIFQLCKQGFLNGVSVGFRSKKSEWITESEDEKKAREKDEPDAPPGKRFNKKELLELSVTPVPANPEALQVARRKGIEMPSEVQEILDRYIYQKAAEALANTKRIKEELRQSSENEPQMSGNAFVWSKTEPFTMVPYVATATDNKKEHKDSPESIEKDVDGFEEDSSVAQPDDRIAETAPEKDVATTPEPAVAQSDASEIAETASETGTQEDRGIVFRWIPKTTKRFRFVRKETQ